MIDKIYEKLIEMQDKPVELRKVFTFSVEDLQDTPETCSMEIKDYLETHREKIEDFYFESYIDEETFSPVLVMHIIPNAEWRGFSLLYRSLMMKNQIFENLVPTKRRVSRIRKELENILNNYLFEFNDEKTRRSMASDIQKILTVPGKYPEVIDITDVRDVEAGQYSFIVRENDNEMTIGEYMQLLSEAQ
jgi:hypothetical protein